LITTGKIDADEALLKELHKKVKIWNARIKAIKGKKMVESITIEENGKERILDVSCIFIALGKKAPGSEMFKKAGVNVDEKGFVVVDRFQRTNIEGVYAAGDITGGFFQISKAIGEGAIAAMHARKYIKKRGE
jgi:thioredoxin reductase (NADPH)